MSKLRKVSELTVCVGESVRKCSFDKQWFLTNGLLHKRVIPTRAVVYSHPCSGYSHPCSGFLSGQWFPLRAVVFSKTEVFSKKWSF